MVSRNDDMLELRDGRRLCFAEYGDPGGSPVLLFHGNPSSRLSWGLIPGSPFRPDLRLIAPDRPGFGGSDFQPGRRLLDWPDDVGELADSLGLERSAVLGASGGGPAALACASKIPERLTAVGLVGSPCPTDAPGATEGMSRTNRTLFFLARHAPGLIRLNMAYLAYLARRDRLVERLVYKMADVDQGMLRRREVRQYLSAGFAEAFRQGGAGSAHEILINHGRPWGFSLEDIGIVVHLWQGEEGSECSALHGPLSRTDSSQLRGDVHPRRRAPVVPGSHTRGPRRSGAWSRAGINRGLRAAQQDRLRRGRVVASPREDCSSLLLARRRTKVEDVVA